jgi:SAM-dependent methyltransferase
MHECVGNDNLKGAAEHVASRLSIEFRVVIGATSGGHREYFEQQLIENEEFFARFGSEPDWRGRSVLDFGCGHGTMSIRAAERGAAKVVGVDIHQARIAFARENLATHYPLLANRVSFLPQDVATVDEQFDIIVSKDTIEHVADVEATLRLLRDRLRDDGEIWVGFSPLYYSPWGDHGRMGMRLPWAHLLPWIIVRRVASKHRRTRVQSLADVDLNGLTPADFRSTVNKARLEIASIRYNQGQKPLLRTLNRLRQVPSLEKFATVSVYAVLTS